MILQKKISPRKITPNKTNNNNIQLCIHELKT
jgi:hypothetical protein